MTAGAGVTGRRAPLVSPNVVALYTIVIVDIPLIADDSHFPRRRYAQPTV